MRGAFGFSFIFNSFEDVVVTLIETTPSADLGGSSNYLHENCKGRGKKRFQGDIDWPWVSRS